MKWFKWRQKYSVCNVCMVHFEPEYCPGGDKWCNAHRQQEVDLLTRKDAALRWAALNWERVEELCKEDERKRNAEWHAQNQAGIAAMADLRSGQGWSRGGFGGSGVL